MTIADSVTSIGTYAFSGCTALTSITIPDSVTSLGDYAFNGCTSLASISIPASLTSIGDYVFNGCTTLASVAIPSGVTGISTRSFGGCTALTSVTIPNSVTSISAYAFTGSSNVVITCYSSSYAYTYAVAKGISYKLLDSLAVTGITLNATSAGLTIGSTKQLTATVLPSNASNSSLTWSSSNTSAVIVYSTGVIYARSAGTAVITCTAKDGSGQYAVCTVKVLPKSVASPAAVSTSYKSVKLTWTAVSSATGYAVFRASSQNGYYHYIAKTTSTSYINTSLTTGQTYYYKIKSYKTVSGTVYYSASSAVIYAKPIPSTPGSVKAARAGSSSVKVSWAAVSGATGYVVYRYSAATKTYNRIKVTKATNIVNTGLKTGTNYYYKVRAYKTVDGVNVYGNPSSGVVAKTY